MTLKVNELKKQLPCEYLRYYGKPRGKLTMQEVIEIGLSKQQEINYEDKKNKERLKAYELPSNLSIEETIDFYYLRACMYLDVGPKGDFEGIAKICAEVMQRGGDIVEVYKAGVSPVYAACLSAHGLDIELQKEIIDARIPF